MSRDEIIKMARETLVENLGKDYYAYDCDPHWWGGEFNLQAFASLVAAAEREACAQAADDFLVKGRSPLGRSVADAIRARGTP